MATPPLPTTNVPPITFTANGFVAPTEAQILAGVQADLNAAFGGNLNPSLSTPQGQLASSMTAIIGNVYDDFLFYVSQTDPAFAQGRMQDAIARIFNLERNPAAATVLQINCIGLPGTVIANGALIQDTSSNFYACTGSGVIGPGGCRVVICEYGQRIDPSSGSELRFDLSSHIWMGLSQRARRRPGRSRGEPQCVRAAPTSDACGEFYVDGSEHQGCCSTGAGGP